MKVNYIFTERSWSDRMGRGKPHHGLGLQVIEHDTGEVLFRGATPCIRFFSKKWAMKRAKHKLKLMAADHIKKTRKD